MIIGLTGKYAAGKGTVAEVLMNRGFRYHSLSDVLRDELATRGKPESREALLEVGNALRREGGAGVLAERILERLDEGLHLVDSIRNPLEVAALRRRSDFVLLGVDAAPRVRFERLLSRARIGDPTTWEQFSTLEARELESDDPTTQQLRRTFDLVDHVIMNDGTIEELRAQVEAWMTQEGA